MNLSVSGIMVQKFWDNRFLQRCFSICWCTALFMSHHSISVWLMSGLWDWAIVTPWLFSSSVILLYLGCCALDHCSVEWSAFSQAFSCLTDDLTFDSRKQMSLEAQGLQSNHYPSTTMLGSFMWYVVSVLPDVAFQPILDGSRPTCAKHAYSYSQFSAWFCQYSCCLILSFWVYCVWTGLNGAAKSAWFRF